MAQIILLNSTRQLQIPSTANAIHSVSYLTVRHTSLQGKDCPIKSDDSQNADAGHIINAFTKFEESYNLILDI